jgi:hypothetical protein
MRANVRMAREPIDTSESHLSGERGYRGAEMLLGERRNGAIKDHAGAELIDLPAHDSTVASTCARPSRPPAAPSTNSAVAMIGFSELIEAEGGMVGCRKPPRS